jgi:hypothetical protein
VNKKQNRKFIFGKIKSFNSILETRSRDRKNIRFENRGKVENECNMCVNISDKGEEKFNIAGK